MSFPVIPILYRRQGGRCQTIVLVTESLDNTEPNYQYDINGLVLVAVKLPPPSLCCIGDKLIFRNIGNAPFQITQREGQQIQIGDKTTTFGVTGRIDCEEMGNTVSLTCVIDSNTWSVDSIIGNVTYW